MGFIGGLFGGGGGSPKQANIMHSVNTDMTNTAYEQSQNAIKQQQAFLQALQGQGGIQNQSNVFNQQQQLAGQLQGVANGMGPNPALSQLHQATGQNVQNQAALMAGQRGGGANAGLLARQAGQQGGALQQQAVGQGATLQAQQQLAGLQALQAQQGMMGNLATQQVGQQSGALGNLNQFAQGEQQSLLNAVAQQNNAEIGNASQFNQAQSNQQQNNMKGFGQLAGMANSIGGGIAGLFAAQGGMIANSKAGQYLMNPQSYAHGGQVNAMVSPGERYLSPEEVKKVAHGKNPMKSGEKIPGKAHVKGDSLKNDTVPKKLKEGGIVLPKSVTEHPDAPEEAKRFVQAILAKNKMRAK